MRSRYDAGAPQIVPIASVLDTGHSAPGPIHGRMDGPSVQTPTADVRVNGVLNRLSRGIEGDHTSRILTVPGLKKALQNELDQRVKERSPKSRSRTVKQEVALQRADKLRDPIMQGVLRLLSRGVNPDLRRRVSHHLQAIRESHKGINGEQEYYHIYAPLLGALWRDREARIYLMEAMRETISDSSERILAGMEEMNGSFYTPVTVIGSGPAGSVAGMTISGIRPDITPLVLEADENIGGIFAKFGYGRSVFEMNTPNTEHDSPNSLGKLAPVGPGHLSGETYTPNHVMGGATAISGHLGSEITNKTTFVSAESVGTGDEKLYRITVLNQRTGETVQYLTGFVLDCRGGGEVNYGVPLEGKTRGVVERELSFLGSNRVPRVMTHDIFYSLEGEDDLEFNKTLDESHVLVVGGGHSAATVTQHLTGRGGSQEQQISNYQPNHIDWAGLKARTVAEFQQPGQLGGETRARYAGIAAELPKEVGGVARINGVDAYVLGFDYAEDGERVVAIFQDKEGNVFKRTYDYIITAPGLDNKSRLAYSDMPTREITAPDQIDAYFGSGVIEPNTFIRYRPLPDYGGQQLSTLSVIDIQKKGDSLRIVYEVKYNDGTSAIKRQAVNQGGDVEKFLRQYGEPHNIESISMLDEDPDYYFSPYDDVAISSKVRGENIFFVGAGSRLELTDQERKWLEEFPHNVNPIALSFNLPKVQLAAMKVADSIPVNPQSDLNRIKKPQPIKLPEVADVEGVETEDVIVQSRRFPLPLDINTSSLVSILAARACSRYNFPTSLTSLRMEIRSTGNSGDTTEMAIRLDPRLAQHNEYRQLVTDMIKNNPHMQSICCHLCGEFRSGFSINIPLENGVVDITKVAIARLTS